MKMLALAAAAVVATGLAIAPVAPAQAAPVAAPAGIALGCPTPDSFSLNAPAHSEAMGNLLDKQTTFGAYWVGGNLPAGSRLTLNAGPAAVTLVDGRSYVAPVVAGGQISGEFPNGGAAFSPTFRLLLSSAASPMGPTDRFNVASISYPVTVQGPFGTCQYTVTGTANSATNVTSITLS